VGKSEMVQTRGNGEKVKGAWTSGKENQEKKKGKKTCERLM